ncbi:MAG: type II toxin-antitoxin system HicB family antitoxin [Patescibacteria group bacterium]
MKNFNLKNIVWKEGKYYVSQCLNVDVSSFGKTKKEALKNLSEAIDLYFEDVKAPKFQEVRSPEIFSMDLKYA